MEITINNSIRPFNTEVTNNVLAKLMKISNDPELYMFASVPAFEERVYNIISNDENGIKVYNLFYDNMIGELN